MVQEQLFRSGSASAARLGGRGHAQTMVPALPGHAPGQLSSGGGRRREELGRWRDPALDRIVYHAAGEPATRSWSIVRLDDPFPEARVASRARTIADRRALIDRLSRSDDHDIAWFLAEDRVPARPDAHPPGWRRGTARPPPSSMMDPATW